MDFLIAKYNYWIFIALLMIGLYGMIAKHNLAKKIIGMYFFQTAIILFYISIGVKEGASIPILIHAHGAHDHLHHIDPSHYDNPLPHVLMLTAIVVGVATLGVALAVLERIHRRYGTIEEDRLLEDLRAQEE